MPEIPHWIGLLISDWVGNDISDFFPPFILRFWSYAIPISRISSIGTPPIHNILPLLKRIRNARPPTLVITDSYWLIVILRKDLTNRIYTGRYTCWLRSFSRQSDKYTHHPPWWGSVRTIIVSQSNRARQRINASPSLTPPCSAWFNKVIRICFLMLPGTK